MRVELLDKVSIPAGRAAKAMETLSDRVEKGQRKMVSGVAGIWGSAFAVSSLTDKYREMHHAIGEVGSLGVADEALKALEKRSYAYSMRYGESAAMFVSSAYDIQSAISGLAGNELATFTEAGNVLAKGTKSQAATITDYMGTMYGIFQTSADQMGKGAWVQMLTGQTALAVQMFKTTGDKMSQAFGTLGADAQAFGISMNEQIGILGKLQSTMGGGEAGSKYKAFLRGVGNAQKELGLTFTDSAGMMLPITDILAKIQKKYGAIDTVAKSDAIKKGFGSDEAVTTIKLLMNDTTGLSKAINDLGRVRGMDLARQMAEKMVDPVDRLTQASTNLRISFGKSVSDALTPFYESGIKSMGTMQRWTEMFPHLTSLVAKITIFTFAFSAAISLLALAKGFAIVATQGLTLGLGLMRLVMLPIGPLIAAMRMAWVVYQMQMVAGAGVMASLRAALVAFRVQLVISTMATWVVRTAMFAWRVSMLAVNAAMLLVRGGLAVTRILMLGTALGGVAAAGGMAALGTGFMAAGAAAWAFTAALLANPITWIVVGVAALAAGLYLLWKHWDTVKVTCVEFFNAFSARWTQFRTAIESNPILAVLAAPFLEVVDTVSFVFTHLDKIPQWFSTFKEWLSKIDIFKPITDGVGLVFGLLSKIPGFDTGLSKIAGMASGNAFGSGAATGNGAVTLDQKINLVAPPMPVVPPILVAPPTPAAPAGLDARMAAERADLAPAPVASRAAVPQGGLMSQINNSSSNKSVHIGKMEFNSQQAPNGYRVADELRLAAG